MWIVLVISTKNNVTFNKNTPAIAIVSLYASFRKEPVYVVQPNIDSTECKFYKERDAQLINSFN